MIKNKRTVFLSLAFSFLALPAQAMMEYPEGGGHGQGQDGDINDIHPSLRHAYPGDQVTAYQKEEYDKWMRYKKELEDRPDNSTPFSLSNRAVTEFGVFLTAKGEAGQAFRELVARKSNHESLGEYKTRALADYSRSSENPSSIYRRVLEARAHQQGMQFPVFLATLAADAAPGGAD